MRKTPLITGEYYHIYNRGVDKRVTFMDEYDIQRFYDSLEEFNALDPIGSIYENSFIKKLGSPTSKSETGVLVSLVAHCANPNHYHLLLKQEADNGIEKLMQRVGTGYTKYINNKYKRTGALFQGKYKSVHIDSNEYLLHLSAYINLNDRAHQLGSPTSKLVRSRSSWGEYTNKGVKGICEKEIILEQFRNREEYKEFALSSLESIVQRKADLEDIADFLLE
ncbi:MAG: transposase [Candidatus Pacebacteria bacterium]|nr:transposase [Candidatus Paceibacterota bacterium]